MLCGVNHVPECNQRPICCFTVAWLIGDGLLGLMSKNYRMLKNGTHLQR